MCLSYAQSLAEDFARDCRKLMESQFYRNTFDTRIAPDRRAVGNFKTTAGGYRLSEGVQGAVTGRGGDFVIMDDLSKSEDAQSEAVRENRKKWASGTLTSRPDSKLDERKLAIMQRLHQDDMAGYFLQQGDWETVILSAIAMEDEEHHYRVAGRMVTTRRAAGEALHPAREPLHVLERLRRDMSHLDFSAQYQQNPLPVEGNMMRRDWLRFYDPGDAANPDRVIQSWDTGSKTGETHDYSVCTTWVVKSGTIFLLDVWRGKLEMPDLCRQVIELADRYGPERVLVEDKGAGIGLIQALRMQQFYKAVPFIPHGDKVSRFGGITAMFQGGHVRLPECAPWLDMYIEELCGFPGTRHDDQVDSTSQALDYLNTPVAGAGWLDYYRSELGGT